MAFEVKKVFRMKEGTDETSYAKNSYVQKQVLLLTKSIKEEAIRQLYNKKCPAQTLCIADLGCSSVELNNQHVVYQLLATVEETREKLGQGPQDYQLYLNDLSSNDFNTVFGSLTSFQEKLKWQMRDDFGHCFVSGIPGSFYDRLFPSNSLHFVHSSYSLHWLSRVPEGIDDNKSNICVARTSPPSVSEAYYKQYQKDFSKFLQCRSQEMGEGGCMVLTLIGRDSNEPHTNKAYHMYELLGEVLHDMVLEGRIGEENLNSFNIPQYCPSVKELRFLIEREGSFALNQVHISEVQWEGAYYTENGTSASTFGHLDFVKCMRAVTEPLLSIHFGEVIIDEVFKRYAEAVYVAQAKENNEFTNISLLMTRI